MTRTPAPTRPRRRGSIMVLAMAALVVLASLALVFARSMRVESSASANYVARLQAEAIARGALEYVRFTIDGSNGTLPADEDLQAEAVPLGGGYFWLLKADPIDQETQAFGLIDEAGKLNVNYADVEMIARLPGADANLAAAIVDWRDFDENQQPGGAESQYYLLLPQPYQAKNSLFETVDELLLVKDLTPQVLFGEDVNRNGVLDGNENDAERTDPQDNGDGLLDRGFHPFVTVYSSEPAAPAGAPRRTNVNTASTTQLTTVLGRVLSGDRLTEAVNRIRGGRPYANLIDLYYRSGLEAAEFRQILDSLATTSSRTYNGLVNINSAPREVLRCLPGLDDNDAEAIAGQRDVGNATYRDLLTLTEILPREKALLVGGRVTTRSYRCAADIVAVNGGGRGFVRCLAVFDTSVSPARVMYWRDLSSLGWPLDPQILAGLRAGQAPLTSGVRSTSSTPAAGEP